jgi:hypothetical protein
MVELCGFEFGWNYGYREYWFSSSMAGLTAIREKMVVLGADEDVKERTWCQDVDPFVRTELKEMMVARNDV